MPSVYDAVSTSLIGDLLNYALALGLAAVAFAYFRRSLLDEGWSSSVDLWRHLGIFFCIALFVLFISTGYEIESVREGLQRDDMPTLANDSDVLLLRLRLLLLLPIDLVGVFLAACLFAVLMSYATARKNWAKPSQSTANEVLSLLAITAVWHLTMISWWVVYGCTDSPTKLPLKEIFTHLTYIMFETTVFIIGRQLASNETGKRNISIVASLLSVSYCILLVAIYCVRLWDYSLRFYN